METANKAAEPMDDWWRGLTDNPQIINTHTVNVRNRQNKIRNYLLYYNENSLTILKPPAKHLQRMEFNKTEENHIHMEHKY